MAPKFLPLLLALLAILAVALPYRVAALAGGWSPIENPQDPEVMNIGKFAIKEHNKETKAHLQFVTVVSGESQVVAGTKYRLVISAKGSGGDKNYEAVVWSKPWEKFIKLESFGDA